MKHWHFKLFMLIIVEAFLAFAYNALDLPIIFPGMAPLALIMVIAALAMYQTEIILVFLLLLMLFAGDRKSTGAD